MFAPSKDRHLFASTLRAVFALRRAGFSIGLLLVIGSFSIAFLSYVNFVPMWDGWLYANDCIVQGVRQPFSFSHFNCFGHPSFAYSFSLALLQYLDPGNLALIHIGDWCLGVLGIYSFHRVAQMLFRGLARSYELVLLTAIFAFMPLFASTGINPNPDFGIVAFTLALLWSLLWNRTLLQALFGLLLVFSKETGILIYAACVAAYYVWSIPRPLRGTRAKLWHLARHLHLGLPIMAFGVHTWMQLMSNTSYWGMHTSKDTVDAFRYITSFALLERTFKSYICGALLNNFNWVLSLLVLVYCVKWAWCRLWGTPQWVHKNQVFTFVLMFMTVLLVTRYPTFSNYRYVAAVGPLLALSAFWSLRQLCRVPELRVALLSLVLVLVGISNWRTIDPISKGWIYGTFKFGTHDMLPIAQATGDANYPGQDALQYNFEFTQLDYALNAVFAAINPEENVFVGNDRANWYQITRLLKSTHHRTLRFKDTMDVRYCGLTDLIGKTSKPSTVHYIDFPNMDELERKKDLERLRQSYDVKEPLRYGRGGYFVEVYTGVRRAS